MPIILERLAARPPDWDARIQGYPGKTLFHEGCWLDHVRDIHPEARFEFLEARDGSGLVGYVPAIRRRMLLVTVLGSPLPGTGTQYLGPLLSDRAALPDVVAALVRYCRTTWAGQLELSHPWLDGLDTRSLGLEPHPDVTHVVPLPRDEQAAWAALKSTCRNRVRKALNAGLVCEVTDDPSVVDHFHEQYVEVYGKQGLALPFGPERPRSLYRRLHPAGRLLPVWVRQGDSVLAAGLFPFDQHAVYFWGAASWLRHQHLCPNELLHWTVMKEAVARGIGAYNMWGGNSQFKDKFGGEDVPYVRYSRSLVPGLSAARRAYLRLHSARLRIRGLLRPAAARPAAAQAVTRGEGG